MSSLYPKTILTLLGIFIDFNDLKNSNKKADVVFYVIAIILWLMLGIYYFYNTNRMGIAEYILRIFDLGRK